MLRLSVGAAQVSSANNEMKRFGNAWIVGIGLSKSEDLSSKPVWTCTELRQRVPFGASQFCIDFGKECGRGKLPVGINVEQWPTGLAVLRIVVDLRNDVACGRREGAPPIVTEAVHLTRRSLAANARGNVRTKFGAMKDQKYGNKATRGAVHGSVGSQFIREVG